MFNEKKKTIISSGKAITCQKRKKNHKNQNKKKITLYHDSLLRKGIMYRTILTWGWIFFREESLKKLI